MQNQHVKIGLEALLDARLDLLDGQRVGLICHPASINSRYEHAADLFFAHPRIRLAALFGPQHGIRGETQDNMIEWQSFRDSRTGLPAYSLYGETRKPTPEMLRDVDVLVFDVQDVGTRVYTFVYTMALAMQAARECGKRFIVLDRPNPINGAQVEGNLLESEFASFVGMYPLPMRHGMTVAELARMFNQAFGIGCQLEVVTMQGWRRAMWFEETGLPWVMPSPNMPTPDTATVYPGMVMFEGTKLSEGRGTTRPFEIIGAPYIEPRRLLERLSQDALPGCVLRPLHFEPTFHKFKGELCGGLQVHVTDRSRFKPVITGVSIIAAIYELYSARFEWTSPPYEYVYDRLPFDVINGGSSIREMIEEGRPARDIEARWQDALADFATRRQPYLLYEG
ncbi:MAG: exo-beta-N-acetylmuramidase NamZ domain-containing protein [Blastocatellia bacterium]